MLQGESSERSVYPFMRYTPDEAILVIINMDDEAVTDYTITIEDAAFEFDGAELLFGTDDSLQPFSTLQEVTPIVELPPYSTYVLRLNFG